MNIEQLRESVDLPPHYSESLPEAERRVILVNCIAEERLAKAMTAASLNNGRQRPDGLVYLAGARKMRKDAIDTDRALVVRCVYEHGPITSLDISDRLGISVKSVRYKITLLKRRGYLKVTGKSKPTKGQRSMNKLAITPAGISYGIEDNAQCKRGKIVTEINCYRSDDR